MSKQSENCEEKNKEYFDEKKYRTIVVGKDGFKSNDEIQDAINALGEDSVTPEEREELLKHLKASNSLALIIESIGKTKSNEKKSKLISICWEIDLDCTSNFLFFIEQVCSDDFNVALEALTVIENIIQPIDQSILSEAQKMVNEKIKQKPVTIELLRDLQQNLSDRPQN